MSAFLGFNAEGVDTRDEYAPIPAGTYNVIISDSEVKQTKKGDGSYLKLTLEVQQGEHQGRKIFHNVTMQNPDPTAVNIGQKHLAQICHAVGVLQVNDSAELHNRPLLAVIKIRKGNGEYGDSNEVKRYEAAQMGAAPAFQAPSQARPAQPSAPAAAAPWAAQR
jgi:hypothetical protein